MAIVVVVAALVLGGDDSQTKVSAERGDRIPAVGSLNRSDDAGADTLRAYLRAALACTTSGTRVMAALSRPGERTVRAIFQRRCASNGHRPWADSITGKLDPDELDQRGRALWAVTADGGTLPPELHVRMRMEDGDWEIDRACSAVCA